MDVNSGRLLGRTESAWQNAGGWHTASEIAHQPAVWREMAAVFEHNSRALREWIEPFVGDPAAQIIFTGAGTSAYIGQTVAAHLRGRLACHVEAIATTDMVATPSLLARSRPTLLVSFARSGNSPESVEAVNLARAQLRGVRFLNIHCNAEGALAIENADCQDTLAFRMPAAACDRGFAMTSSYTSMMLAALAIFDTEPAAPVVDRIQRLANLGQRLITDPWSAVAGKVASLGVKRMMFIGSGPLAALAREAALKVLELNAGRMVAFNETSMGLRHGPKALIDDDTLVCCLISTDPHTRRYDLDMVRELRDGSRRCHVLEIDCVGDETAPNIGRIVLPLAEEAAAWTAPVIMILLQQIALELSLKAGLTPDNPFPDGSVNRVVQGVTIHALPGRAQAATS